MSENKQQTSLENTVEGEVHYQVNSLIRTLFLERASCHFLVS